MLQYLLIIPKNKTIIITFVRIMEKNNKVCYSNIKEEE